MEKPTPTTREFLIEFWKKEKGLRVSYHFIREVKREVSLVYFRQLKTVDHFCCFLFCCKMLPGTGIDITTQRDESRLGERQDNIIGERKVFSTHQSADGITSPWWTIKQEPMKKKTTPPDSLSDSFKLDEIEPLISSQRERETRNGSNCYHTMQVMTLIPSRVRERKKPKINDR